MYSSNHNCVLPILESKLVGEIVKTPRSLISFLKKSRLPKWWCIIAILACCVAKKISLVQLDLFITSFMLQIIILSRNEREWYFFEGIFF